MGYWFSATSARKKTKMMTQSAQQTTQDSFLRAPHITERMGVSRSYWWAGVKSGKFPAGIKLSTRVTVWRKSEIDRLISQIGK